MKGLFGGMLGFVNLLGGAMLTIMIGSIAWRNGARWARIIGGALMLGVLIGAVIYSVSTPIVPVDNNTGAYGENVDVTRLSIVQLEDDRRSISVWCGFATSVTILALEKLRLKLEGRVPANSAG